MKNLCLSIVLVLLSGYSLFPQSTQCTGGNSPAGPAAPASFICGSSFMINHVAGIIAPVTKTVMYGTVTGIPGEPAKCWITSNLGADHQAAAVDDASEASGGWYWQFNLRQGYKHDGTARIPATAWSWSINENSDWTPANDPCALELGNGWRIPTSTEWSNVRGNSGGNWTNWNGPWNSDLKLHAAGYLLFYDGSLFYRGAHAYYWSSTQNNPGGALYLDFGPNNCYVSENGKSFGQSVRCLKDQTLPSTQVLQNFSVPNGQSMCFNASDTISVAGSGTNFWVQPGGSATMIAGQNIRYLPGTTVYPGGHLWGYIAPGGPYCQTPSMPAAIATAGELPRFACAQASFDLYPNPTTGIITLERTGGNPVDEIGVEIFGMTGETVLTEKLPGAEKHEFSLAEHPSGLYFVRVISGKMTELRTIIKL